MKLIHNGKKTNSYYKLVDSALEDGAIITRREKGYSDFNICIDLVSKGFCVWKPTGPRGGKRLHITELGKDTLKNEMGV